jgi:phosphotransferase system  glucose/maltose/N-acetylglucosamine-specific IIC component
MLEKGYKRIFSTLDSDGRDNRNPIAYIVCLFVLVFLFFVFFFFCIFFLIKKKGRRGRLIVAILPG